MYYLKEQKEKHKTLAQLHANFAPVLPVLLHIAIDFLCTAEDDDVESSAQLLLECQNSIRDLCSVLFEFFGKQIVQPCRDLFEKATSLSVSQSAASTFLTQVESDAACATA